MFSPARDFSATAHIFSGAVIVKRSIYSSSSLETRNCPMPKRFTASVWNGFLLDVAGEGEHKLCMHFQAGGLVRLRGCIVTPPQLTELCQQECFEIRTMLLPLFAIMSIAVPDLTVVCQAPTIEYVGLEKTDDGVWSLYFYDQLLARLDERAGLKLIAWKV